ncbi:MAG: flavodoxin family protein [Thermoplasmata archaeon]|jgi:NAD(P)H-dependent FMN reductase|nr:flavodoxin family protein [Thermoplasmata archaeon]
MSEIIILNAAARKNGNTSALVQSFTKGAKSSGNNVREFYLQTMNIRGCIGCMGCTRNADPCTQKDEMSQIYDAFKTADVVVLSSPVYFLGVAGTLKTAIDRLFAMFTKYGAESCQRDSILLMTSDDPTYEEAVTWYRNFIDNVGWNNLGEVLGSRGATQAESLGASIQ